jgi:hypothetical protein
MNPLMPQISEQEEADMKKELRDMFLYGKKVYDYV